MKNQILVFVAVLVISCQKQASENLRPETTKVNNRENKLFERAKNVPLYEEGVILFQPKAGANVSRLIAKEDFVKHIKSKELSKKGDLGIYKKRVAKGTEAAQVARMKASGEVEFASLNYSRETQQIPNDPYVANGQQWQASVNKFDSAWLGGNHGSSDVLVVMTDEGRNYFADDVCKMTWRNPKEVPDNNVDDDLNGKIDDVFGWDAFNNTNRIYNGVKEDHGQHVSSIIGATANNGNDVAGGAYNVKLATWKFLEQYGFDDAAIEGLYWTIDIKKANDYKSVIVTASWGGGGFNQLLINAIAALGENNILFVAAAGNSGLNVNTSPMFPAGYNYLLPNIISVGAHDWAGNPAGFSMYGDSVDANHSWVDLFAAGTGIPSHVPNADHTVRIAYYGGTSMATPQVTAALVLYYATHPGANWRDAKRALLDNVTKHPALTGKCKTGGLLNANFGGVTPENQPGNTICTPPIFDTGDPSTPLNFQILDSGIDGLGGYVTLDWQPSTDPEGNFSHYSLWVEDLFTGQAKVVADISNSGALSNMDFSTICADLVANVTGTRVTVAGILPLRPLKWWVVAWDEWSNDSEPSNSDIVYFGSTPPPDTQAPTLNGDGSTTVTTSSITFSHPAASDNVAIASYTKYRRPLGGTSWLPFTSTNLSETFNVPSGSTYEFYYTAKDLAGNVSVNSEIISATTLRPPPSEDIIAPVVTILSPADGYIIPAKGNKNVKINFTATDNVGVVSRQILIDGVVVATNVSSYTWNANKASKGNHVITCRASDAAGNEGSKSVTVVKN